MRIILPPPIRQLTDSPIHWARFAKQFFPVQGDNFGKIISVEGFNDVPFLLKRVYFMYDTVGGVVRGKHAHKTLNQVLVCVSGRCKILLDDGHEKKIVPLENPNEALFVAHDMWHEMYDFSTGAVLLVFAAELYDESDYIRNYDEFLKMVKGRKNED